MENATKLLNKVKKTHKKVSFGFDFVIDQSLVPRS